MSGEACQYAKATGCAASPEMARVANAAKEALGACARGEPKGNHVRTAAKFPGSPLIGELAGNWGTKFPGSAGVTGQSSPMERRRSAVPMAPGPIRSPARTPQEPGSGNQKGPVGEPKQPAAEFPGSPQFPALAVNRGTTRAWRSIPPGSGNFGCRFGRLRGRMLFRT